MAGSPAPEPLGREGSYCALFVACERQQNMRAAGLEALRRALAWRFLVHDLPKPPTVIPARTLRDEEEGSLTAASHPEGEAYK